MPRNATNQYHHKMANLKSYLNRRFAKLRLSMATIESVPQLALLGAISGIIAGLVIVAFRILIEYTQMSFLPGADAENYEGLSPLMRLLLATVGGLVVGLLFQYIAKSAAQVGVVHTMERLAYHQGRLPLRNAIWQFIGGAITIISGHSVGREGPSVHLGAASGSLLGQWLQLSNSSTRTLVACGVAAAIAASFNTPLAGVIFAMEVVLMEYTIAGFIPVIMAAVLATIVCHWFFGSETVFLVPDIGFSTIAELPFVLVLGLVIGVLAATFIELLQRFVRISATYPLWQRTTLAGFIIGVLALGVPQIMGIGYDTVNAAMLGEFALGMLIAITLIKILATTIGLGLGLIGPTLVIGATAGGVIGIIADALFPGSISSPGFYAIIGMGAMMGATLHAPLAALIAMLELTANPNIILPGMLAIVAAALVNSHLFGKPSVFIMLIKERGLDFHDSALAQSLRRIAVANVMDRHLIQADQSVTFAAAQALLAQNPSWIIIACGDKQYSLLPPADLAQHLLAREAPQTDVEDTMIDLLEIPAMRLDAATIHLQASLQEAHEVITRSAFKALCVVRKGSDEQRIEGVLTESEIESHYQS